MMENNHLKPDGNGKNAYTRHRTYWRLQGNKRSLDDVVGVGINLRDG
jgi:hypothetical protein